MIKASTKQVIRQEDPRWEPEPLLTLFTRKTKASLYPEDPRDDGFLLTSDLKTRTFDINLMMCDFLEFYHD